ncbi:hypothetical protein E3J61_02415 [Candidatus Dependentiae bacterium]|nr:MAG: hypothetical protein E3J61_02415 [Candidatus Dependentiae bacterium]
MKRILLIIISLNILATHAQTKPAREHGSAAVSYVRPTSFSSQFNHRKPAQSLSNPLSWNDVSNGLQQVMGTIRDAIIDKRLYGPLSALANATKDNVVAGMQKIGDISSRISGYLVAKGAELVNSSSGVIKVVMNTTTVGSNKKINTWQSGFMKAREQHAQKMREKEIKDEASTGIQVIELETVTHDEPAPPPAVSEPVEIEPVLQIEQEPEALHIVEPESKPSPEQEQPEPMPIQEVKEIAPPPKPVMVKEPVSITPVAPSVELKRDQTKLPVLQEESKTILEKEVYQPVRKNRSPVVDPQDIDLFDVQSEFAHPSPSANYQPSPFMNGSQPMPVYQQQVPTMQQQPMQFATAPVYQANQNQLSNVAMQMHSSAMAMQMQAANLMAQAQQQPYMPWQQSQQVPTQLPTMRDHTKQEKTTLGMQAIQQVINAGEGAVQHLLLILDLEFDILEHLLAGNTGRRVDDALRERNNAIKNSNPVVVTAYDRLVELATTYGNDGDIGGRLYHYCVRKSKRAAKSPIISPAKKKFLLHMMCVLERYYEIIEKMQRVTNLNY